MVDELIAQCAAPGLRGREPVLWSWYHKRPIGAHDIDRSDDLLRHLLLQDARQVQGPATESADMVEISIAADAAQVTAPERPFLPKLGALLSRLSAAWETRRLATVDRIRRAGLAHID